MKSIKKQLVTYLVNNVFAGTRCFEIKRKLLNSAGYEIGEGSKVVAPLDCTAKLIVGKNCWIGKNLIVHGNGIVIIEDNCDIAPEVTFLTGGHEIGTKERRAGKGIKYTVRVKSGTWLCARSTIGKNTTVGKSCVVAANACVMNDVEDNCLVGGVPARIIRRIDDE